MASASHPRHGFWYKVGFVFTAILIVTLLIFVVLGVTGARLSPTNAAMLGDALVSSFFLGSLSFLIDSIRFKRNVWIVIDGIFTLVALFLIIRFSR